MELNELIYKRCAQVVGALGLMPSFNGKAILIENEVEGLPYKSIFLYFERNSFDKYDLSTPAAIIHGGPGFEIEENEISAVNIYAALLNQFSEKP